MLKEITVWLPSKNTREPIVYPGSMVEDYTVLNDGDTLAVTLKDGARFRYSRMPYIIELNPATKETLYR
jgi:hypothetical protein